MVRYSELVKNTESWLWKLGYTPMLCHYSHGYSELICREFSIIITVGHGPTVLAMSSYFSFTEIEKALDFIQFWELK